MIFQENISHVIFYKLTNWQLSSKNNFWRGGDRTLACVSTQFWILFSCPDFPSLPKNCLTNLQKLFINCYFFVFDFVDFVGILPQMFIFNIVCKKERNRAISLFELFVFPFCDVINSKIYLSLLNHAIFLHNQKVRIKI